MDSFVGFENIGKKKDLIIPILSQYDFLSAVASVFAITSWRNNRGAQESCLSLNLALATIKDWGSKSITSAEGFDTLFQCLIPFLQITPYDDPVVPDFGEIKLNYNNEYYSVITGTGHTAPVFAALQFLENLSEYTLMHTYTIKLLKYSNYVLNLLHKKNAHISENFTLCPIFESPSFEYFEAVKDFIIDEQWKELDLPLLSMLSAESNEIVKSHFFKYRENYYPLFNPSLIIDYQNKILLKCSEENYYRVIHFSLIEKLYSMYNPSYNIIRNCMIIGEEPPRWRRKKCFASIDKNHIIIFLYCDNQDNFEQDIERIQEAHKHNALNIVDLDDKAKSGGYTAYQLLKECKLSIICFNNYLNVDETHFQFKKKDEKRVYSSIDLMYMIMYSHDIFQIADFDSDDKNTDTQIFSWGGASDYFTTFLSENGYLSKGATTINGFLIENDTSASNILTYYLQIKNVFPFHFSSKLFPFPECWNVFFDENEIMHFSRKADNSSGGPVFKFSNGCVIYLSYVK